MISRCIKLFNSQKIDRHSEYIAIRPRFAVGIKWQQFVVSRRVDGMPHVWIHMDTIICVVAVSCNQEQRDNGADTVDIGMLVAVCGYG